MIDTVVRMVLVVPIVVAMVALAWASVQPTRQSVVSAVVCLLLLPAVILGLALVVWVRGR
jgi:hypothetical protein